MPESTPEAVITPVLDPEFVRAIREHSKDWQMRAIAGLVTREAFGASPGAFAHGVSRAHTQEELEAWCFGFHWVERELTVERSKLCDLLQGRVLREYAREQLATAFELERLHAPAHVVTNELDRAAHLEWIARISEQGMVAWGGRLNRCNFERREET